jgi:L-fucose isomerase-like protein
MRPIRAAFVGFGEVNTPREFIDKRCEEARKLVEHAGVEIVSAGPVSDDPEGKEVRRAVSALSGKDFDFIIFCVAGWIPSHAVISVAQEFSAMPMLLWGLCGWKRGDVLVTTADQAGTSALRKAFEDLGYRYRYLYNIVGKRPQVQAIVDFGRAARAERLLEGAKMGMMGYRDMNLYTTLYDGMSLRRTVGTEVEVFDMLDMVQRAEKHSEEEVKSVVDGIRKAWTFEKKAGGELLGRGVRYFLALRQKVEDRGYLALSLIDVDGMKKLLGFPPAMVFMLLADELGVSVIPENDVLGGITQMILRLLTGQIAAYFEFYEFFEDRVLMGVPDFVPSEVVDGPPTVTVTQFGELEGGVLNISKVKTGRVTLCRLTSSGDRYAMHLLTGEAVEPGAWEEAGWEPPAPRLPSLEVVLDTSVEEFAQKVMSQHYIIVYGDHTAAVKDFCRLRGIRIIE